MNSLQISHITLPQIHLPRFHEIPNVGLYLKQVVIYINEITEPLLHTSVTPTMLSNYVKLHLVSNPTKKMYHREQIATLLFIVLVKNVLSLDHIRQLLEIAIKEYELSKAYDSFCNHLEEMLQEVTEAGENMILIHKQNGMTVEHLLQNVIASLVQYLYMEEFFAGLSDQA